MVSPIRCPAYLLIAAMLFLAVTTAVPRAHAVVLIYDDFSGSSANPLGGTTPDTTTNSAAWTTNTNFRADGSVSVGGSGTFSQVALNLGSAYFDNNPGIYTLSLDATPVGPVNQSWVAMGLTIGTPSQNGAFSLTTGGTSGRPWMIVRANGLVSGWRGQGTNNQVINNYNPGTSTVGLKMVLDTTGDDWFVDMYVNNVQLVFDAPLLSLSQSYVVLGTGYNNGDTSFTIDNFRVEYIPEPGALTLAALSLALVIIAGPRRRR